MPIEEKLAAFLESYEAVLKVMHRRFKPVLDDARNAKGKESLADLKQRLLQVQEYFARRMEEVPIPPGASAVNFEPGSQFVHKLDYGSFALKFNYMNWSFGLGDNYASMTKVNPKPLPGSTLTEMIEMIFAPARRVEWKAGNKKLVRTNGNRADYCKSGEGVMEIGSDASRGKFWSPARWEAGLRPKIEIGVGEGLERDENLTYMERRGVITDAMFRKRAVGSGEIDAFLKMADGLPAFESPYLLKVKA